MWSVQQKKKQKERKECMPKSCKECPYKYKDVFWFCKLEKTENSEADIDDHGEPFGFVPEWCKLRGIKWQNILLKYQMKFR